MSSKSSGDAFYLIAFFLLIVIAAVVADSCRVDFINEQLDTYRHSR